MCPATRRRALSVLACAAAHRSKALSPRIAAELPAQIRDGGVLRVGTNAAYAPNEFIAAGGRTIIGMDAHLAQALGRVLGLRVQFSNVAFDQLITGLAAGRYDIAMSSLTDTTARQQTVNMVTYFDAGNSFVVLRSNSLNITGFSGPCGHAVAIEAGSTYVQQVAAQQSRCAAAGKPKIIVRAYANQADANLALLSKRAQITIEDSPVAAYQARQDHRFRVTGRIFGTAPYGIAMTKTGGLAKPIRDALRSLIANGTHRAITSKWGISTGDIGNPVINGAAS